MIRKDMVEITRDEFWHNVNVVPPLLRLGYSDGPGAFMCSEPSDERLCAVTGKLDYDYSVTVILEVGDTLRYYEHVSPLTLNEFMALCERIMPGVGVCDMGWGRELLDSNGNVRADIVYPVRHPVRFKTSLNREETE